MQQIGQVQPFHLDEAAAAASIFRGLAASGWHTAAITVKLLVESDIKPAGSIVGAGFDDEPVQVSVGNLIVLSRPASSG
jgi:hypothetical protein